MESEVSAESIGVVMLVCSEKVKRQMKMGVVIQVRVWLKHRHVPARMTAVSHFACITTVILEFGSFAALSKII